MNGRIIAILITLFIILFISEYTIYSSLYSAGVIYGNNFKKIFIFLGISLPVLFAITMIYSYKNYSLVNSIINSIGATWIGFLLYFFAAAILIFILVMLNNYFNFHLPIKSVSNIILIFTFILVTTGIINSCIPRIARLNITSEALSNNWKDKKIVIISDVHLGTMRREQNLKRIINKINNEKPDIVFILGDLIDGPVIPYEKWLGQFSNLPSQYGTFYIEGNHEKYSQEYENFKSKIPSSIINLTDKKVIINNTQIVGLDYKDIESKEIIKNELDSIGYNQAEPSIVLIHDPRNVKYLADYNSTLVLSGHTHGGQLFPFTLLIKYLYREYSHGISLTNNTIGITSYGTGTAILPIRIGTFPEIIVLNIN